MRNELWVVGSIFTATFASSCARFERLTSAPPNEATCYMEFIGAKDLLVSTKLNGKEAHVGDVIDAMTVKTIDRATLSIQVEYDGRPFRVICERNGFSASR